MADGQFQYIKFMGTFTRSGAIARDEAMHGTRLCVANAQTLLETAEALKTASAASAGLAVLVLEEIAKIDLLLLTATIGSPESTQWKAFWNAFANHKPKLRMAIIGYISQFARDLHDADPAYTTADFGRSLNAMKQLSWYVDRMNGRFVAPGETFQPPHAEPVFLIARNQVEQSVRQMGTYGADYDDLAHFARGAETMKELWLAQVEIAKHRRLPNAAEIERGMLDRIQVAPDALLTRNVFA